MQNRKTIEGWRDLRKERWREVELKLKGKISCCCISRVSVCLYLVIKMRKFRHAHTPFHFAPVEGAVFHFFLFAKIDIDAWKWWHVRACNFVSLWYLYECLLLLMIKRKSNFWWQRKTNKQDCQFVFIAVPVESIPSYTENFCICKIFNLKAL